jgi:hypothetical protein
LGDEQMKDIIIKYRGGQSVSLEEARSCIDEYMEQIQSSNPYLLNELFNGMNPFYHELIMVALDKSIIYFEKKLEIHKLMDEKGKLIKVF